MTDILYPPELVTALVAAAKAVGPVAKASTGPREQGSYAYRGTDDVVDACRQALLEQGVMVHLRDDSVQPMEKRERQGGAPNWLWRLDLIYTFVHVSGASLPVPLTCLAWGDDSRALGSARSYGLREALQRCLLLATGIPDVEAHSDTDRGSQPPEAKPRRRKPDKEHRATADQRRELAVWLEKLAELPDGETKDAARRHWHTVVGRRRDSATFTRDEATRLLSVLDGMNDEVVAVLEDRDLGDPFLPADEEATRPFTADQLPEELDANAGDEAQ